MTQEQVYVIMTSALAVINLGLHIWQDRRRQEQTRSLLARPIHLEITLAQDTRTGEAAVKARVKKLTEEEM